jgi:hypothetical protein
MSASGIMDEFRKGELHDGHGRVVKSRKQARAIQLSYLRKELRGEDTGHSRDDKQ